MVLGHSPPSRDIDRRIAETRKDAVSFLAYYELIRSSKDQLQCKLQLPRCSCRCRPDRPRHVRLYFCSCRQHRHARVAFAARHTSRALRGHFGFCGHNDPVAFRNVQVKAIK